MKLAFKRKMGFWRAVLLFVWLIIKAPFLLVWWVCIQVRYRPVVARVVCKQQWRELKRRIERLDRIRNPHKYRHEIDTPWQN